MFLCVDLGEEGIENLDVCISITCFEKVTLGEIKMAKQSLQKWGGLLYNTQQS